MGGQLVILGCGGSAGVPAIGNWWGKCDPNEPKNRRTRPSIALKTDNTLLIVDTGPDFREQINREQLGCPDAIIITHVHADHINGIDELRVLQRRHQKNFPVYAMPETLPGLMKRADYMFEDSEDGFYPSVCHAVPVDLASPLTIGDITLNPFVQNHGAINTLGLRIGSIGYSTDMKRLDQTAIQALKGIETWIVDGMGGASRNNPVHTGIEEIIEMNREIGAGRIILTHLPPVMDYKILLTELPENIVPAFDGMMLEF